MSYQSVVLADHPTLLWQFADASGAVAIDSSGNGIDGNYGSTSNTYHKPSIAWSGDFSIGLADRVYMDAAAFDTATLAAGWSEEGWVRPSVATLNAVMGLSVNQNNVSEYGSAVYIDAAGHFDGSVYVPASDTVIHATSSTVVVAGRAYHVVFVVDIAGNAIRMYVNGALEKSSSLGGHTPETFVAFYHFGFCGNTTPNNVALSNGGIYQGDAQFSAPYPAPLSSARVAAHYAAGTVAPAVVSANACAGTTVNTCLNT